MKLSMFLSAFFIAILTCHAQADSIDLVVKNAAVFDSRKGKLLPNKTVFIKNGLVTKLTGSNKNYAARKTIDAGGKLVTPGFIDAHIHLTDVLRSYGPLPEYFAADSQALYRKRVSDAYMPYGTTTAMIMGQSEKWLRPVLDWQAHPAPQYIDIYTVGGALVSDEGRKPYINHTIVATPQAARQKVIANYNLGLRHVKLYWKLRRPEFEAALKTADSLGMNIYGHVDQNVMYIDTASDLGLSNYEHILTLVNTALHPSNDGKDFDREMQKYYAPGAATANRQLERLEMFRYIHDKKPGALDKLIDKLAKEHATFSTSIHLMAEPFGLTWYTTKADTTLTPQQAARCRENFDLFMGYVKKTYDKGIKLRIGTDWPSGGKAIVSEQLLLSQYGFSIPAILQICTLNGAIALDLQDKYGSIDAGKKADILIWNKSPFDDPKNFLAEKTIIKNGVVVEKQ